MAYVPQCIKQSHADCSTCDLLDAPSCIMETNSKVDLTNVDVVFVAENPGPNEIKKGLPLVGPDSKIFRKYFNKYIKKDFKYALINSVLCLPNNDEEGKPLVSNELIDECKKNCFHLIETCNPKLIVCMGTSPMKAFGIAKGGITDLRGQVFKWKNRDILVTVHPRFVHVNKAFQEKFEDDIKLASTLLKIKLI